MPISYTNHIGHSSRDKHSGKNTAIATASDLTATEKHNNHDYTADEVSRMQSDINLEQKHLNGQYVLRDGRLVEVEGHLDLSAEVRRIYEEQFAEAVKTYNEQQLKAGHPERQISSYFDKISEDKQQEIAVEGLIQFGSLEDWQGKSTEERKKVVPLLLKCLEDTLAELKTEKGEFLLAGASLHLNEGSPHLHYVGVCVADTPEAKRGLKKRVNKSAVFTRESLGAGLQDNVRAKIEPEVKKVFGWTFEEKTTGRNEDRDKRTQVNEMLKKEIQENKEHNEELKAQGRRLVEKLAPLKEINTLMEYDAEVKSIDETIQALEEDTVRAIQEEKENGTDPKTLQRFLDVLQKTIRNCSRDLYERIKQLKLFETLHTMIDKNADRFKARLDNVISTAQKKSEAQNARPGTDRTDRESR